MTDRRLSPQICVTISPHVLKKVDAQAKTRGQSRSSIISEALRAWLEKHPVERKTPIINGILFNPHRKYTDYTTDDMSDDDLIRTLQEYEAATSPGRR